MLRNFPHQVNQIPRLRQALAKADQLLSEGLNIADNGVYGYSLARARICPFEGLRDPTPDELEQRILVEQQKPAGSQGARTFARELRRTFLLLGFLRTSIEGPWELTELGQRIVSLDNPPDPEGTALWQDALLHLCLVDRLGRNAMHPAKNMLRIVAAQPDVDKKWLAFALDMLDDSDEELERVLQLIRETDFDDARQAVGASKNESANAVKILPSLLKQTGLISIKAARCSVTPPGAHVLTAVGEETIAAAPARGRIRRRRRSGYEVGSGADVKEVDRDEGGVRTDEEQVHSAQRLSERTRNHQALVRRVVDSLRKVENIRCSDDAYDVICRDMTDKGIVLIEAKTIREDGLNQARLAVGQLLFYEYFDAEPEAGGKGVTKVAAFDEEPGEDARRFLGFCDVACVVLLESGILADPEVSGYFPE